MSKSSIRVLLAASLMTALVGCESLPFQAQAPAAAPLDEALLEQVEFYRPYEIYNADFEAKTLGAAAGIDCQSGWGSPEPDQTKALLALKAEVYNLGGNAVVLTHCQRVDLKQCDAAIQCDGTGYQIDKTSVEQSAQQKSPLDQPEIWF